MALDRGKSDTRAVAAAGGAMALVALVSLTLVVTALSGGEEQQTEAGASEGQRAAAPARNAGAAQPRADATPVAEPGSAERALLKVKAQANRVAATAAAGWPAGQEAWTVVLANTVDEPSAQSLAESVEQAGVEAGVLSSAEHPSLGSELWLVFSGVYADQLEAGEAAAELQALYPGAYPQYVE